VNVTDVPAAPTTLSTSGLLRVLGVAFGLAIAVGATIGGGILGTPGDVAARLPTPVLFMGVWVFGAVNALLGATVYSELGAMIPQAGGIYVFAHRAMGEGVGFFVGYGDWINWSVSTSALILLVGEYLGNLVPPLAGHATIAGFAILGVLVLLQWQGVVWGGRVQELTSVLKALALVGLVVAAFVLPHPTVTAAPAVSAPHGLALLLAIGLAMQGVIFTYDSYYAVVYCGEEIRDPGREIPRSIFRGLLLIIVIYLLVNAAFLAVLPMAKMAHDPFVGGSVARAIFGARGDAVIRSIMIVSVLGTVNAQIMVAPRILLAMGRDRIFPHQATRVNAGGTPVAALVVTLVVIAAFLFTGSFNAVLAVDSVLIVVLYAITFTSLFVLRRTEPDTPRPYRAWGYPWVQGAALAIAIGFLVVVAIGDLRDTLIALALFALSWPAAKVVKRYRRDAPAVSGVR